MARWAMAFVCLVSWLLQTGALAAQSSEAAPDGYEDAVALGLKEMELQNFSEARARFLQAHQLYPNARTLRALGKVEYELRHYVEAVQYLQQSLDNTVRPLSAEMRGDVQDVLAKADGYVARYQVVVTPANATLQLDGTTIELPSDGMLMLGVGDHVLIARADSYQPMQSRISVVGGESSQISLSLISTATKDLSPAAAAATTNSSANDGAMISNSAADDDSSVFGTWWLWTGVGVVVVAAVVTGVALSQQDPSIDPVPGGTAGTIYLSPAR